jgi:DivIVA domain-containing protein
MTLSLDDVRNKRFRMARKSGYEVLEVDEFVDEVEATFEQLFEENRNLKKQVESLKSTGSAASTPAEDVKPVVTERRPDTSPAPAPVATSPEPPFERIVVTASKEASSAVVRLVELSTDQAERLVAEATAEAAQIREQASTAAAEETSQAHVRAESVETEARAHAERLQADAQGRAESLNREIETRRTEMFGELEKQRDELTSTVQALRSFEATYRSNLTRHLQSQIEVLASGNEEPADPPAALDEAATARPTSAGPAGPDAPAQPSGPGADDTPAGGAAETTASDTPRLDALLGDQR